MNCNLDTRGVFCNRTLNLNAIRAIGYDMDYTLVHYRMKSREHRAYDYIWQLLNKNWGLLMRTGIDKSHLARQIERYADIYTARVSNFLHVTPTAFLRSSRGSLPHDPECLPGEAGTR